MEGWAICPFCYCCALSNHSHDKGMCPSCKHISTPFVVPRAPVPFPLPSHPSSCACMSSHPCLHQLCWSIYHQTVLICPDKIHPLFPRRAERDCFSPRAHFQESACEKLQCSRRCPTFILHSSPWDCYWPLTKEERARVWVSRGVCICASRLYQDACVSRACLCSCISVYVCT